MCYKNGYGVTQNTSIAIAYFEEASKKGHGRALYEIGLIYETNPDFKQNIEFALNNYLRAIKNGYLEAAIKAADIYFSRGKHKTALQLLEKCSDCKEVQCVLGKYYFTLMLLSRSSLPSLITLRISSPKRPLTHANHERV